MIKYEVIIINGVAINFHLFKFSMVIIVWVRETGALIIFDTSTLCQEYYLSSSHSCVCTAEEKELSVDR